MRETQLETLMVEMGKERYRMKAEKAKSTGRETTHQPGRYLLRESVAALSVWLRDWRKGIRGRNGRIPTIFPLIEDLDLDIVAFVAMEQIIDGISTNHGYTTLCYSIGRRIEDEVKFTLFAETDRGVWMALQRTAKKIKSYKAYRATVEEWRTKCGADQVVFTRTDKVRIGHLLLTGALESTGIIELRTTKMRGKTMKIIQPTAETHRWLQKSHEYHESLSPYYMPTAIPPAPWRSLTGGGYHTGIISELPFVRLRWFSGVKLGDLEGADMTEVYSAVNAIQDTAWKINAPVFEVMRHLFETDNPLGGLPPRNDVPFLKRPIGGVHPDQADDFRRSQGRINAANKRAKLDRLQLVRCFYLANKFEGLTMWFPHNTCSRGRMYPIPTGSPLHPQGPKYSRALLTFAHPKPITTPAQLRTLVIHGANTWGEDKVPFSVRERWVADNEASILAVHEDPLSCTWWADADNPWGFLAFCLDYGEFKKQGWGYLSGLPIPADGSNNGLQIYSLLMRDKVGAKATNCSYSAEPQDIYQDVADDVTVRLGEMLTSEDIHTYPARQRDPVTLKRVAMAEQPKDKVSTLATNWLKFVDGVVPRTATKRPVMTIFYGLRHFSALKYVAGWFREAREAKGTSPWGESDAYLPSLWLGNLIWDCIHGKIEKASECMVWLRKCGEILANEGLSARWTAPSGFPVIQACPATTTTKIKNSVGGKITKITMRSPVNGGKVKVSAMRDGIAPNYVHSLDASCVVKTVNKAVAECGITSFAMVHDSYATVAADAPDLQRITREVYAAVFSEPLLANLRAELQALLPHDIQLPPVPELGDLDPNCVLDSPYFFQ